MKAKTKRNLKLNLLLLGAFALLFLAIYVGAKWRYNVSYPMPYKTIIEQIAPEHGLEPELVNAIMLVESACKPQAVSEKGAVGLMQLMPETAQWVAQKSGISDYAEQRLTEPEMNIKLACCYLEYLYNRFSDTRTVLAAYNGGEGNVAGWIREEGGEVGKTPVKNIHFAETRYYVSRVEEAYENYRYRYHHS
nr:lytic transglycosylase domain-containing protein [bacterium]